MKKYIIILILFVNLFSEIGSSLFIMTKERDDAFFIKPGFSFLYCFDNNIEIGLKTSSGIIRLDNFNRKYYRDLGLQFRYYFKIFLSGVNYNIRISNLIFEDNIFLENSYIDVFTGIGIRLKNYNINLPVYYKMVTFPTYHKLSMNQFTFSIEVVFKYSFKEFK